MHSKAIKNVGDRSSRRSVAGYILPVVIILGLAISIISATALNVVSTNSTVLNNQYYVQLALDAAHAGIAHAEDCIHETALNWTSLTPSIDCQSVAVPGRTSTVLDNGNVQSTYTVAALQNPYNNTTRVITSTGYAKVKDLLGRSITVATKVIRVFGQVSGFGNTNNTVTKISAGTSHTCAIVAGRAYCWGYNGYGQLGTGLAANSSVPVPVDTSGVLKGKTVTDISAGLYHTCAVASGAVYCWGYNDAGQLGNNSYTSSSVPVAVDTSGVLAGKTVTAVSAGGHHTCAIASGAAYCWGAASNWNLGGLPSGWGMYTTLVPFPVAVDKSGALKGKTVTAIGASNAAYGYNNASYDHSCAIADDGIYCWGGLWDGQLGNGWPFYGGSLGPSLVIAPLTGKTATSITSDYFASCAVANGAAYCWGLGTSGQLGNNATTTTSTPVAVDTSGVLAGKTVTAVDMGFLHACAIANGAPYCWGNGSLGTNATSASAVPVAVDTSGVLSGHTVTDISTGMGHSCVIADGSAYCWGDNSYGDLGNGSTTASTLPVAVTFTSAAAVVNGATVTGIGAGTSHACSVASGAVYCWGNNQYGQLGNGQVTNSNQPVAVDTSGVLKGKTVTAISSGDSHTCAVASGAVYCWGYNNYGQLGNNSTTSSSVPVAVNASGVLSGKTVTAIAAGNSYTCALANGAVYCWGYNGTGQLGNNSTTSSSVPVAVNTSGVLSGKTVTAISAGSDGHACAVANGAAYCWGFNSSGQLGNNSTANSSVPVAVSTSGVLNGKTVTAVSAGNPHTCAIASGLGWIRRDGQQRYACLRRMRWVFLLFMLVGVLHHKRPGRR
jgi:alpha-tubulin suppressor-like RCC1 family protein